mmetsp:Transcript_6358/g.27039  ORF Transcript_6358/g.27039 Transcript_6358/m.27039 type:complete len:332 (-) Transcript_6358:8-1003(-)
MSFRRYAFLISLSSAVTGTSSTPKKSVHSSTRATSPSASPYARAGNTGESGSSASRASSCARAKPASASRPRKPHPNRTKTHTTSRRYHGSQAVRATSSNARKKTQSIQNASAVSAQTSVATTTAATPHHPPPASHSKMKLGHSARAHGTRRCHTIPSALLNEAYHFGRHSAWYAKSDAAPITLAAASATTTKALFRRETLTTATMATSTAATDPVAPTSRARFGWPRVSVSRTAFAASSRPASSNARGSRLPSRSSANHRSAFADAPATIRQTKTNGSAGSTSGPSASSAAGFGDEDDAVSPLDARGEAASSVIASRARARVCLAARHSV